MKMIRLYGLALLSAATFSSPAHANQWVSGYVSVLEEYGIYDGGALGVLVTISDQVWTAPPTGEPNGATACQSRFSIVVGKAGVDESIKNRMFSLLLSAGATRKKVKLWLETSESYCKVAIASIVFE